MSITILFSLVIYHSFLPQIGRTLRMQRFIFENPERFKLRNQPMFSPHSLPPPIDPQLLEEAKNTIRMYLAAINLIIFVISGGAAYFLAGRTLRPIEEILNEQKRFIADASHELRTPLTALKTSIEVNLRDDNLTLGEARGLLASNLEEVNNLQSLSENLIKLAQYEKTNNNTVFQTVSLLEVIQDACRKVSLIAEQKHIDIQINEVDVAIEGDYNSLVELFVIFLDNAIKYSPENSSILITLRVNDHSALVDIKDQGIGISDNDVPRIFDRFYRADESRSKMITQGYGLGLSVAKKIVDIHKGSIDVKSESGKGTTFTITLPSKISKT
jgi:signal transduction histidine kinase